MTRGTTLILGLGLLAAPPPLGAQEIYQAIVLDLSVLEVQIIVVGARGDEKVQCLLRDRAGRVRVGGVQPVSAGMASGRSTLLSIPLPLLDPHEREFAVALVRGDTVVTRTDWQPLFRTADRAP
ncbi:MAG: hypothetical protein ACRELA_13005 [Candidatus Rokuibacteriota bacterium]